MSCKEHLIRLASLLVLAWRRRKRWSLDVDVALALLGLALIVLLAVLLIWGPPVVVD